MEYLPTDLPKYMKTTSREAVANSPVEAGHVLLFSEDGTSLTAKKSDGSFESVGGGSNVVAGYIRNNNGALTFCEAGKLEGGAVSQITVSGAGTAAANGIYTTNSAVTGIHRTWRNKSTGCSIAANVHAVDKSEAWWSIWDSNGSPLYSSSTFNLISGDPETSPWELSWNASAEASPAPSVSHTMVYPTGSAGDTVAQLRISETLKPAPDYAGRAASTKKATDINPTINQTKYITPALAKIKDYTPVLKIGEEYFVNGIGGDFIPGGDFYKCSALVAASEGGVQGQTISFHGVCQMDGMTPETADLSFTMEDTAKTGWERTWLSSDGTLRLQAKVYMEQTPGSDVDDSARTWFITSASNSATNVWEADNQGGADGPANPWGMSTMMYDENGMLYTLTWTVSEASAATPASWSGYKATQGDDGKYSFAETATTGLSYDGGFTPQVGTIYTADAKVKIAQLMEATAAIPQDGLVFWMPFDGSTEARLGSVAPASDSYTGNITYETSAGITYANVSNMLYKTKLGGDSGINYPCTIIAYVKIDSGCAQGVMIDFKAPGDYYGAGYSGLSYYNGAINSTFSPGFGKFHLYCQRQTGVRAVSITWDNTTHEFTSGSDIAAFGYMYIGGNTAMPKLTGGFFDVAVYDRVLTDAEVTALYQRVIPLQA